MVISERERVSVCDFSGMKDMFQVFDQFMILSRSEEMEEAAACLALRRMRDVTAECGISNKEIKRIFHGASEIIDEY